MQNTEKKSGLYGGVHFNQTQMDKDGLCVKYTQYEGVQLLSTEGKYRLQHKWMCLGFG